MIAMRCKPRAGAKVPLSGRLGDGSDQAEAAKARMALLADDDVVVHEDAERFCGGDDLHRMSMSARDGVGSPDG